jgi:hypothetical protein
MTRAANPDLALTIGNGLTAGPDLVKRHLQYVFIVTAVARKRLVSLGAISILPSG